MSYILGNTENLEGTISSYILQSLDGSHICPQCGKRYKHKTSVYKHLKNQCGVEPKYKCIPCNFACKFLHVLRRHRGSVIHQKMVGNTSVKLNVPTIGKLSID